MKKDDAITFRSTYFCRPKPVIGIAEQEVRLAELWQVERGAMPYIHREVLDLGARLGHKVFLGIAGEDAAQIVLADSPAQGHRTEAFVAAGLYYDLRLEHPDESEEKIMEFEFRSGFINDIPESLFQLKFRPSSSLIL